TDNDPFRDPILLVLDRRNGTVHALQRGTRTRPFPRGPNPSRPQPQCRPRPTQQPPARTPSSSPPCQTRRIICPKGGHPAPAPREKGPEPHGIRALGNAWCSQEESNPQPTDP